MTPSHASPSESHVGSASRSLIQHVFEEGSLRSLLPLQGFDDDTLYDVGYELYMEKRYELAALLFALLNARDSFDRRYLRAYATCLQMMGRPALALSHHLTVALMDLSDPLPIFHACECLIAMGRLDLAREGLTKLRILCQPGVHDALLARVQGILDLVNKNSKLSTEGSANDPGE